MQSMNHSHAKSGKYVARTRRNGRRLSPNMRRNNTTSTRNNERFSSKDRYLKRSINLQSNISDSKRPRLNETSETPFTHSLSSVDPLFAAAAAAAVMNAGLRTTAPAVDFSPFCNRNNASSNATVAAVAAAAMNAAAIAAALGSPITGTSTDTFSNKRLVNQLARIYRPDDSVYLDSRLEKSCSYLARPLQDNTHSARVDTRKYEKKTGASVTDRLSHHWDNRSTATRTLFVGNLVQDIAEDELRRVFGRYGHIEDIDIKRPEPGSRVNAYAFVRFVNLDVAHRAKMAMSGKLNGQFACKIGYGKVQPTRCLWIGGLGSWISYSTLTSLLDRFGKPERIIWPSGKDCAHVLYPTVDLAVATADALRRYSGGDDRRMRVDYADEESIQVSTSHRQHQSVSTSRNRSQRSTSCDRRPTKSAHKFACSGEFSNRGKANTSDRRSVSDKHNRPSSYNSPTKTVPSLLKSNNLTSHISSSKWLQRTSAGDRHSLTSKASPKLPDQSTPMKPPVTPSEDTANNTNDSDVPLTICTVTTTDDLSACLSKAWDGTFYLKSSSFPCRMHMLRGDLSLVGQFMANHEKSGNGNYTGVHNTSLTSDHDASRPNNELVCLRITQRMKLDPVKLDDVSQRINAAGNSGFCVLLAVPPPNLSTACQSLDSSKQSYRPLRNLISYLRTKDSAGVVLLNPQPQSGLSTTTLDGLPITGVLHAFPPCDFAFNMLKETAVRLQRELTRDDHLVVLLIRSTGTV